MPIASEHRPLRVLFQNRPNVYSKPGGDTVVMDRLKAELERLGVHVDIALEPSSLATYDVVHLFNLHLAEEYARNAVKRRTPFVVTTLYEDWPRTLLKRQAAFELFRQYLEEGRDERLFQANLEQLKALPPCVAPHYGYVARHAACLLACSSSERNRLQQDYADLQRVEVMMCGAGNAKASNIGREIFSARYGVGDFVLCVGRLDTRKNQLMLLKALEAEEIPVVLITGGVIYEDQKPYADLCNKFQRRGKTLFLERISEEMLVSAYRAARVLCLPSWCEVPGLVALEAARYGCRIVASRWGALEEYLAQGVWYCEPDDPESIRSAITQADAAPVPSGPQAQVLELQWRRAAEELVTIYRDMTKASRIRNAQFDVSIIMVVGDRVERTQQCLSRLAEVTHGVSYEVIVVDNGSTDDTPAFLATLDGDVRIQRNEEGVSWCKACNQGARLARGRYLVFLSPETVPVEGWLEALVRDAEADDDAVIVGSKLVSSDETIKHAGLVFARDSRLPYPLYWGFPAHAPEVNRRREFQAVTGKCMLVRQKLFDLLGGFDEAFCQDFADVDLCLRAREWGGSIIYQPESVVYYLEDPVVGGQGVKEGADAQRLLERWKERWLEDEDSIVVVDGYVLRADGSYGIESRRLEPLLDAVERTRWERVAQVQWLGQAGEVAAIGPLLAEVEAWPADAGVLRWRAEGYRWMRSLEGASHVQVALVRSAIEQGLLEEADRHLTVLLAQAPGHGGGWLLKGRVALQRRDYPGAAQAFAAALRHGGDGHREQWEAARQEYEQLYRRHPGDEGLQALAHLLAS